MTFPSREEERRLYVSWRDPETRRIHPVGLLIQRARNSGTSFTFGYLKLAEALERFNPLPGFPELHRRYDAERLFPVFANRVMPRERPDYGRYVEHLNLAVDADPFVVLGRSGGTRATDRIEVFPAPEPGPGASIRCSFFVRGIRHIDRAPDAVDALHVGDQLVLVDDHENEANPRALLLHGPARTPVGYVPDYLVDYTHDLRELNLADPQVSVEHVNTREVAPHLRLLCQMSAPWPDGYEPFSGPEFQPLVDLSDSTPSGGRQAPS